MNHSTLRFSFPERLRGEGQCNTATPGRYAPATTQGHHLDSTRVRSDGRQKLAVKLAESLEELPLVWVRVDLQGVALQGQHEDSPAS